MTGRPHDILAEQIALGAMMLSPEIRDEIADIISPADHYRPAHQTIHAAILRLRDRREPTDFAAVKIELESRGELRGELTPVYPHTLTETVPTVSNGPYFARKVRKFARKWRLQEELDRARQIASDPAFDPDEDMDRVRDAVDKATAEEDTGSAEWLADAVYPVIESLDGPLPPNQVPPPYADLRDVIPAVRPGQLITVAARPSIGKTVVLGDFARHAALRTGLPVIWFTLEMSRDEIITRCIAAEARVSQEHLQQHTIGQDEWGRIEDAAKMFGPSQMLIDERGASTSAHIRSQLRAMTRTARPALVAVDYIQLMRDPDARTRQEEVSELARGLKAIAKEFEVPVLAAAQLNRGPEARHDKRPLQSDLRESGEIENSSDVVILLHREDYYEPESPRAGEMDLIVSKNRNGRLGTVTVTFQGRFCRCVGMSREDVPADEWTPSTSLGVVA